MAAALAARRYRRCGPVFLEYGDQRSLDPAALLQGRLVDVVEPLLRAHVPGACASIELDALSAACLASFSAEQFDPLPPWLAACDDTARALGALMAAGLIESQPDSSPAPEPAAAFTDWFGPAALYHFASRWSAQTAPVEAPADGASALGAVARSRAAFEAQARRRGAPPTHRPARGDLDAAIALPRAAPNAFDALLAARETHRLFDTARPLSLQAVATLLARSFGAGGEAELGGGLRALRKSAPSGGGMHPVEAYPLVVDVSGLACGWYHYRACDHQLAPMLSLTRSQARAAISDLTAGQHYFATAPLVVALTLRFPRHHWKYPGHPRAYRVLQLEAGHVGQTFYLAATEAGLGAFFTAAVNDADVDRQLGLDGIEEGCIAIVGCGYPAPDGAPLRLSSHVQR